MDQRRAFLSSIALLVAVVGLLPVLFMLGRSIVVNGEICLAAYRGLLSSQRQWLLMGKSLALASLVTLTTVSVGVPLGVLLGKTDLPLRRLFAGLLVVPLLVPPYVVAVSWADLLGDRGLLAGVLGSGMVKATSHLLFGLPGCVLVLSSVFLPVPMLLTMVFLRTVNPRLEEAGLLVAGWGGVLRRITLPLVLPGVVLSAMVVFLFTLGEFTVPNFLRFNVFAVESFTRFSAFYDFEAATAAAVPLAAVTFLLLGLEGLFLRQKTCRLNLATGEEGTSISLGRARPWLGMAVALFVTVTVAVPLSALVVRSGGASAYLEALQRAGGSLLRSLEYAAVGATLLTFLGFFTGYLVETRALGLWWYLDSLTLFLFALPSTVIGIGLIGVWNRPFTNLVYGTPVIVVLGYVAKYLALTSRISVTQLGLIPSSMEEAAQVLGAGWLKRIASIVAPLARPGLVASWFVAYLFALRDTGITMLVYPPGHDTLPVRIYTLMANGAPSLVAALCVVMVSLTLLPLGGLLFAWTKARRRW